MGPAVLDHLLHEGRHDLALLHGRHVDKDRTEHPVVILREQRYLRLPGRRGTALRHVVVDPRADVLFLHLIPLAQLPLASLMDGNADGARGQERRQ